MLKAAVKCVIVLGLESSGTRYLSRGIAKLQDPQSTWNGESPECYRAGPLEVEHVSLPFFAACNPHEETPVLAYSECEQKPRVRFIVNATEVMRRRPECKAVVVTRSAWERRSSTESRKHCTLRSKNIEEERKGWEQLHLALKTFPKRTRLISYEWFSTIPDYVWHHLSVFLELRHFREHEEKAYDANFKQLVDLHKSRGVDKFIRKWLLQ